MHIIDQFIVFLVQYRNLAYVILFAGSMFDTIIGISFFVYGEIFFLSGAILAGVGILNVWIVILVLYSGGILGDNISYFLGRKYGILFYNKLKEIKILNKFINEKNFIKGSSFFNRYGALGVFLGRLLGPLSWVTPFVAGTYKLEYRKFLPYEIVGVIIGIGLFIVVGYFLGKNFNIALNFIETYVFVIVFVFIVGLFLFYFFKKKKIFKLKKKDFKLSKKKSNLR